MSQEPTKLDPFLGRPLLVGGLWALATIVVICGNVGLTGILCERLLDHAPSTTSAPWLFRATIWLGDHYVVLHVAVITVYAALLGVLWKRRVLRECFFVASWGLLLVSFFALGMIGFAGYIQAYG